MFGGQAIESVIARALERWGLHDDLDWGLPVPIERLARSEGWAIHWGQTYPLLGYAVKTDRLHMRIEERLSDAWTRVTIAHEVAHVLCRHRGRQWRCLESYSIGSEADEEREAHLAGLRLLVPVRLIEDGLSPEEIAARCVVPVSQVRWMIEELSLLKEGGETCSQKPSRGPIAVAARRAGRLRQCRHRDTR